jgi:hypothetical protein
VIYDLTLGSVSRLAISAEQRQLQTEKENYKERRVKMTGQPNIPGDLVFDVTHLEVTAEPGMPPSSVVKKGDDFDLTATFTGAGGIWTLLELLSDLAGVDVVGKVTFSAEGMGADADEEDFGPEEVVLTAGGSPYTVTTTVPKNTLDKGAYIVACWAEFEARGAAGGVVPLPGLTGNCKGLGPNLEMLSVY